MKYFHSYAKLVIIFLLVATAIYLEVVHKQQGAITGILSGLALIEALVIFDYETQ